MNSDIGKIVFQTRLEAETALVKDTKQWIVNETDISH